MAVKLEQKIRDFAKLMRTRLLKLENQIDNDCFVDKRLITRSNVYQEVLENFEEMFEDDL